MKVQLGQVDIYVSNEELRIPKADLDEIMIELKENNFEQPVSDKQLVEAIAIKIATDKLNAIQVLGIHVNASNEDFYVET